MTNKEIAIFTQLNDLNEKAIVQATVAVDQIIISKITDYQVIENQLEVMLDFCSDNDMLLQYRRLCSYYWQINPQTTAYNIQIYRELWDEESLPAKPKLNLAKINSHSLKKLLN